MMTFKERVQSELEAYKRVLEKLKEYDCEDKEIAIEAMKLARDTSYSSTQDCPKCAFIDEKIIRNG